MSTIAFLGLCAFVVASIYVLSQKYRQVRNYKASSSRVRLAPNLESARALSNGTETGQTWAWQAESEIATADQAGMREGAVSDDREVPPIAIFSYQGSESDEGDIAEYEVEGAKGSGVLQHKIPTGSYFTPASVAITQSDALWANQKQAGQGLDQVRRNVRSRTVIPNGVVVGQVGDSEIAQRRRTASNGST